MPGTSSPPPRVSDHDMHHGTCVTHVPWRMPGSLTSDFLWSRWWGKTFPAFPAHAQPAILRIWLEAHWRHGPIYHAASIATVYPKKYAHGFVVLCFVVVIQSFIMNSHEVFIHIHQGCFAGTGAIVRLPQCQWSKPDGYWKINQCITTTKHSKAKTVCIFLGIYCRLLFTWWRKESRHHQPCYLASRPQVSTPKG